MQEEKENLVEVEVMMGLSVEVFGKGKDYSVVLKVKPSELIDVLRYKVSFFKTMLMRRYILVDKKSGQIISNMN